MPIDKKGKFHLNSQFASSSDKLEGTQPPHEGQKGDESGEKNEAPGGVHEHLKALHGEMGGKHMHIHHDGLSHTSHQVGEDGQVEGPHEHENLDALKEHMGRFFDEEKMEGAPEEHGPRGLGGSKESKDHASLYL